MSNKKKLPVGVDSFNKLVQHDFYYIDKTGLPDRDDLEKVSICLCCRHFLKLVVIRHCLMV